MPSSIYIVIAVTLILGLFLLWRGFANLYVSDLHKGRGKLQLLLATVCLIICAIAGATAFSLSTYKVLPNGKPLARITFEAQDQNTFNYVATIKTTGDIGRRYEIGGNQWVLDLRVVHWDKQLKKQNFKDLFQVTGLHSSYSAPKGSDQFPAKDYKFLKNNLIDIKDVYNNLGKQQNYIQVRDLSSSKNTFIDGGTYDIYLDDNDQLIAELVFDK